MTVRPALPDDLARIMETARVQDERRGTLDAGAVPAAAIVVVNDQGGLLAGGWNDAVSGRWVTVRAFWDDAAGSDELFAALLARAQEMLAGGEVGEWIRLEHVLRPETEALPAEATALYERHGFALKYIELEMARGLDGVPDPPAVGDVRLAMWTPERDAAIREAYNDAFRTRGFAGYSVDDWVFDSFSVQDEFLPACSFLALVGDKIIGFSMCVVEAGEGWIDSVGVEPAWRGRGIASAVLLRSMLALRDAGLTSAVLRVNEDNPQAILLYRRLGFEVKRKHAVWQKASTAQ